MRGRRVAFLAVTAIVMSMLTPQISTAAPAVKPGAGCLSRGAKKQWQGKTITCVLKGKKLQWSTPVAPRAAVAPAPANTAVPLPLRIPLTQAADYRVVFVADSAIRTYVEDAPTAPSIEVLTGPNTNKARATEYLASLFSAAKGWSKDWSPQSVTVAIAAQKDYEWIKPLWPQYGLKPPSFDDSRESWERQGVNCNQGGAIYVSTPFFWGCLPESGAGIGLAKFGGHEYTHLVQYGIIHHEQKSQAWNLGLLLAEGSADLYGMVFATTNSTREREWNEYWRRGFVGPTAALALKYMDTAQMEAALLDAMEKGTVAKGHWYYTGSYVTARLIAAEGHDGFLRFMRAYAKSNNVYDAFRLIYGMSFAEFAKIVAPEIVELTKRLSL